MGDRTSLKIKNTFEKGDIGDGRSIWLDEDYCPFPSFIFIAEQKGDGQI